MSLRALAVPLQMTRTVAAYVTAGASRDDTQGKGRRQKEVMRATAFLTIARYASYWRAAQGIALLQARARVQTNVVLNNFADRAIKYPANAGHVLPVKRFKTSYRITHG